MKNRAKLGLVWHRYSGEPWQTAELLNFLRIGICCEAAPKGNWILVSNSHERVTFDLFPGLKQRGKVKSNQRMNIEDFREYCLCKPGVTEEFPFDEVTLVFKVMGKMFALTNLDGEWSLALKCDPQRAIELREQFPAIQPGYHMNKVHWNTVLMDGSLPESLIVEMIDQSYQLVVSGLPRKVKEELARKGR